MSNQPMKSDPLQGILFKTKPVRLETKARARAQLEAIRQNEKPKNFFSKLPTLKRNHRLTRKPKLISDIVIEIKSEK
jgi:hypothetical protein